MLRMSSCVSPEVFIVMVAFAPASALALAPASASAVDARVPTAGCRHRRYRLDINDGGGRN